MLKKQKLLYPNVKTKETHVVPLPACCPISKNPLSGSKIIISYYPIESAIEVASLHNYINAFTNGFENVRGMEDMIRRIAIDCFKLLEIPIHVKADLIIEPNQEMIIEIELASL